MLYTEGMKVIVIEDCRPGHIATGQTATYEGQFNYETGERDSFENPRFRLQDGSVIWGCECWWTSVENAGPLPQMQEGLEQYKTFLRELFYVEEE